MPLTTLAKKSLVVLGLVTYFSGGAGVLYFARNNDNSPIAQEHRGLTSRKGAIHSFMNSYPGDADLEQLRIKNSIEKEQDIINKRITIIKSDPEYQDAMRRYRAGVAGSIATAATGLVVAAAAGVSLRRREEDGE